MLKHKVILILLFISSYSIGQDFSLIYESQSERSYYLTPINEGDIIIGGVDIIDWEFHPKVSQLNSQGEIIWETLFSNEKGGKLVSSFVISENSLGHLLENGHFYTTNNIGENLTFLYSIKRMNSEIHKCLSAKRHNSSVYIQSTELKNGVYSSLTTIISVISLDILNEIENQEFEEVLNFKFNSSGEKIELLSNESINHLACIKTNSNNDTIFHLSFNDPSVVINNFAIVNDDILMFGKKEINESESDAYACLINSQGQYVWEQTYFSNSIYSLTQFNLGISLENESILLIGKSSFYAENGENSNYEIFTIDKNGDVLESRWFLTSENRLDFQDIVVTNNGSINFGCIATYLSDGVGFNYTLNLIYRFDEIKSQVHSIPKIDVIAFPNPCHDQLKLFSSSTIKHVSIFNSEGRLLFSGSNHKPEIISSFLPGIYYFEITTSKEKTTKSILKVNTF